MDNSGASNSYRPSMVRANPIKGPKPATKPSTKHVSKPNKGGKETAKDIRDTVKTSRQGNDGFVSSKQSQQPKDPKQLAKLKAQSHEESKANNAVSQKLTDKKSNEKQAEAKRELSQLIKKYNTLNKEQPIPGKFVKKTLGRLQKQVKEGKKNFNASDLAELAKVKSALDTEEDFRKNFNPEQLTAQLNISEEDFVAKILNSLPQEAEETPETVEKQTEKTLEKKEEAKQLKRQINDKFQKLTKLGISNEEVANKVIQINTNAKPADVKELQQVFASLKKLENDSKIDKADDADQEGAVSTSSLVKTGQESYKVGNGLLGKKLTEKGLYKKVNDMLDQGFDENSAKTFIVRNGFSEGYANEIVSNIQSGVREVAGDERDYQVKQFDPSVEFELRGSAVSVSQVKGGLEAQRLKDKGRTKIQPQPFLNQNKKTSPREQAAGWVKTKLMKAQKWDLAYAKVG